MSCRALVFPQIRGVEAGLRGSWFAGSVVAATKKHVRVRFFDLLTEDGAFIYSCCALPQMGCPAGLPICLFGPVRLFTRVLTVRRFARAAGCVRSASVQHCAIRRRRWSVAPRSPGRKLSAVPLSPSLTPSLPPA